jgi:hypothetical protein
VNLRLPGERIVDSSLATADIQVPGVAELHNVQVAGRAELPGVAELHNVQVAGPTLSVIQVTVSFWTSVPGPLSACDLPVRHPGDQLGAERVSSRAT